MLVELDPDDMSWPLRPVISVLVVVVMNTDVAETPKARSVLLLALMTLITRGRGVILIPAVSLCTMSVVLVTLLTALPPICRLARTVVATIGSILLVTIRCTSVITLLRKTLWRLTMCWSVLRGATSTDGLV